MMKPENRLMRTKTMRLPMMVLLLAGFVSLSGCIVTHKVLDLRKERETRIKEATNFWSLSAVRSAHIIAGSDVFACTEFRDSPADAPQAYTINLSQASRIGKTFADVMPVGYRRTKSPRGAEEQPDVVWYLYPLQEAQKGCGKATGESPFPVTALKIETVQIHPEDQSRLPAILLSPDGGAANEGRIIEVSFASGDHGTRADPELKKAPMAGPSTTRDVLLVYLPAAGSGEQPRVLGIAGAFEPGSEWVNPYTLLVAPAVVADTAIITAVSLVIICSHGGCR
jgi:hypothetical protein